MPMSICGAAALFLLPMAFTPHQMWAQSNDRPRGRPFDIAYQFD
jgi:hypothetical protein